MRILMRRLFIISLALSIPVQGVFAGQTNSTYSLQDPLPGGIESYFTTRILKFLDHWPPSTLPKNRETFLRAIKTPNKPDTIGMVKHFVVNAPFSRVVEVTDNYKDYPKMWHDVVEVTVLSSDKNRNSTAWTRRSPAIIVPRLKYKMATVSDRSRPGRVVYRQQLIDTGNSTLTSDALVVLEALRNDRTQVSVLNFFEPKLGAMKGIIGSKIWSKSMENSVKDDLAFCAHVEHPDWTPDQIQDHVEKIYDAQPLERVEYTNLVQIQ